MKRMLMLLTVVLLGLAAAGCPERVSYSDPDRPETLTADYGSTDLKMIAEKMVSSLLEHPVSNKEREEAPIIWICDLANNTSDYINTKDITNKIQVGILKSGKFRFSGDKERLDEARSQLKFQDGGDVDPATAKKIGKMIGADYLMYGEISSIEKKAGRERDVFFIMTLKLQDVEKGLIEWADEKEIRKEGRRPLIGG